MCWPLPGNLRVFERTSIDFQKEDDETDESGNQKYETNK